MRVLYLATRVCWPVISGAHLRDFHLARHLARTTQFTYAGMDNGPWQHIGNSREERLAEFGDAEFIRIRRGSGYNPFMIVRGLLGPIPLVLLNYTSSPIRSEIELLVQRGRFDVIQLEGVFFQPSISRLRELAPQTRFVADWHNIESEILLRYAENVGNLPQRLYARRTAHLLRKLEDQLLAQCDVHTVCSEREREALLSRGVPARVEVIPNGVDVQSFAPTQPSSEPRRNLVFVGSMDYHANVDGALYFAREVWPKIRALRPNLKFVIVGSRPTAEILALNNNQPGVTVTGTVDDVRPYYQSALASIVSLRVGGGTRLKVLEAMAAGTPVVSTTLGAEGLAVTHGKDVLIADTPAEMVDAIVQLQNESEQWRSLVLNSRRLVETRYDWSVSGEKLLRLHQEQLVMASAASNRTVAT